MMKIEDNNAFLMAMGEGSRIEIHAADAAKDSWTQIDQTAEAGSTTLNLAEDTGWQVGDKIAIASSGFDMDEAEYRTITAVSEDGKTVTLDAPLEHQHFGEIEMHNNGLTGEEYREWELDMRAEVALLSRNVTIQGDADSVDDGYGGHTMIMNGASMHIDGAELTKMGQIGEIGRYPLHWHMLGDGSGQYVTNSSVHETFNKGVTIHGTSNTWLENNAIVDTIGHTYYFEDGSEQGNVLLNNLGMNTVKSESVEAAAIGSDHTEVSTYWVTNPNNHLINNHAAGSDDTGFWVLSQDIAEGKSTAVYPDLVPRDENPGTWVGNVSHSNADDGFWIGSQFDETTGNKAGEPRLEQPFRLEDYTSYKNGEWGIWLRNGLGDFEDLKIADSNAGIQMWGDSNVSNSLFVGRSTNADDTLDQQVGWQMYDHPIQFADVHFTGYTGEYDTAISNGWGFGRSTTHNVEGLTFGEDVLNKYLHTLTIEGPKVSDQGGVFAGAIIDSDGSLTGTAGAVLTPAVIDYNPDANYDIANHAFAGIEAAGFNANEGAIYLEDARAWVNAPGSVIGKMALGEFYIDDERAAGVAGGVSAEDFAAFQLDPKDSSIALEDRAVYTIERSDNGAKLEINKDAMVSYSWEVQFNVDTADGVEYVIDYTDGAPEMLKLMLSELPDGASVNYRFKGLPEDVVFQEADAAASLEEFNAATGSSWYYDAATGDYLVKAVADRFLPWQYPRNDSEIADDRVYNDEIKIYIADRDVILPKPDGNPFASPEDHPWQPADPDPVPTRAESTSDTVDITNADQRWSDATSWDGGVPGAEDIVIVGPGQRMVLDTDAMVKAILVNGGELIVEDTQDLALSADWILVINGGLFQVGTEENPHQHDFDLTLEGDDRDNDVDVMMLMASEADTVIRAVTPEDPVDPVGPVDPVDLPNQKTVTDDTDTKPWTQYTDTFDDDGTIVLREMLFDDGRTRDTEYQSGKVVRHITTDAEDQYKWSTVTNTYRLGELAQSTTIKDDGTVTTNTFALAGGPRVQSSLRDLGDNFTWDSQVTKYNLDGERTETVITFDDGRVTTTNYVGNVRTTQTQEDLGNAKSWSEINSTFDSNGKYASLQTVQDDGIVTDTTFSDGQKVAETRLDTADVKSWSVTKVSFEDGKKAFGQTTYDDGRVATTDYQDGVRKSLKIVDGADEFEWYAKTWEYDVDGAVIDKSVIMDSDPEAGGDVGFVGSDAPSSDGPTFYDPSTFGETGGSVGFLDSGDTSSDAPSNDGPTFYDPSTFGETGGSVGFLDSGDTSNDAPSNDGPTFFDTSTFDMFDFG